MNTTYTSHTKAINIFEPFFVDKSVFHIIIDSRLGLGTLRNPVKVFYPKCSFFKGSVSLLVLNVLFLIVAASTKVPS